MAKKPASFRLWDKTLAMMDEICERENIDSRGVLVDKLVDHYYHFGPLADRVAKLEQGQAVNSQRIEALEANQAVQAKNQPNSIQ